MKFFTRPATVIQHLTYQVQTIGLFHELHERFVCHRNMNCIALCIEPAEQSKHRAAINIGIGGRNRLVYFTPDIRYARGAFGGSIFRSP